MPDTNGFSIIDDGFGPYTEVDPRSLQGRPVPPREWIVREWLPAGHTTVDYGDGGVGKTLLGQQLMTSCATGAAWCGLTVARVKVLGLFCEDDDDELHRRQENINQANNLFYSDLGDMRWISGVGRDNLLMTFDREGRGQLTERYSEIERLAVSFGAQLVIIDTAADTFGGNENDRSQVRQYISVALNRLAIKIGGAVLLNAHPSRSGMKSGDMDGGSTAWNATVRSRLSLAYPAAGDDGPDVDPNERVLTRRKANYASIGDTISLRWQNGVLVPLATAGRAAGPPEPPGRRHAVEELFLTLLDRTSASGMTVSHSRNAGNWAPRMFAKRTDAGSYGVKDFDRAMSALFTDERICVKTEGRSGDRRRQLVRAAADTPDPTDETPEYRMEHGDLMALCGGRDGLVRSCGGPNRLRLTH